MEKNMNFLKRLFNRRPKAVAHIEMPEGSTNKIELKGDGFFIDRKLTIPVPVSYGYIPETLSKDGDPLDIFVISEKFLDTGDFVDVEVIGVFECLDQGLEDDKILAVAKGEKVKELEAMAKVANYLMNYKPGFEIKGWKEIKNLDKYRV
jgi:inorganic pyrophosphatase